MNDATAGPVRSWPSTAAGMSFVVILASVLLGPLILLDPRIAVATVLATALVTASFVHPPVAGYLVLLSPLLAGLGRGTVLPLVRPGEAITVLVGAGVVARLLLARAAGDALPVTLRTTDLSVGLLALAGSCLPLAVLLARGGEVSQDDVLYAFQLLKFGFVYLIVRVSIRDEVQVDRCLQLAMAVGSLVAVIGILQALDLFGVRWALLTSFPPTDDALVDSSRASSTLAHPFAMADLMVFNLAVAGAWLIRRGRNRLVMGAAALFAIGALASGEFSGALALLVTVAALGLVTGQLRRAVVAAVPVLVLGGLILQPVIDDRLRGFSSPQGLPDSWIGRLHNLQNYVWPRLTEGLNWVVGVRPSARVPIGNAPAPFVYIESGYTWLLWVGGIPLMAAFVLFLITTLRAARRVATQADGSVGVAATAAFVSVTVVAVLTVLDPHLTLRGSGELLFALLALAGVSSRSAQRSPAGRREPVEPSLTIGALA